MSLQLEVQLALEMPGLPTATELRRWAEAALREAGATCPDAAELVIRIVNEAESTALNETYRRKQGPTNVLSFPFEAPPGVEVDLLGDLVICAPVVASEAVAQGKAPESHWAHMVVHGVLHLLGHDHQTEVQAAIMESLETRILAGMGYPDPYTDIETHEGRPTQ